MNTITIPKTEYEKLKHEASLYERMAADIAQAEEGYWYDMTYIATLTRSALRDHKKGKSIRAASVDEALKKFSMR